MSIPRKLKLLILLLALQPAFVRAQDVQLGPQEKETLENILSSAAALGDRTQEALKLEARRRLFPDYFRKYPDRIWSAQLSTTTQQALDDFKSGREISTGVVYGQSVKALDLRGKTFKEVDALLVSKGFKRNDDFIRDFRTGEPKLDRAKQAMPLIVYTHPDGGMVRVKPKGDSTDKFRPKPNMVKAVRCPYDADYRKFALESFKVDNDGNALPKWPSDLRNPYHSTEWKDVFLDSWGDTVHTDLKKDDQSYYWSSEFWYASRSCPGRVLLRPDAVGMQLAQA